MLENKCLKVIYSKDKISGIISIIIDRIYDDVEFPSNINWENMDATWFSRKIRILISTSIFIFINKSLL
jgi:hypothetical protein